MIRGGHIDYALFGAFQVAPTGDIVNWTVFGPGKPPSVGGAMDLAAGARNVWVLMEHTTRDGGPRLVERCSYPLTAPRVVKRIYTSLAVLAVEADGFVVHEILEGLDLADLEAQSGAELHPAADCSMLRCPPL